MVTIHTYRTYNTCTQAHTRTHTHPHTHARAKAPKMAGMYHLHDTAEKKDKTKKIGFHYWLICVNRHSRFAFSGFKVNLLHWYCLMSCWVTYTDRHVFTQTTCFICMYKIYISTFAFHKRIYYIIDNLYLKKIYAIQMRNNFKKVSLRNARFVCFFEEQGEGQVTY